METFWTQLLGAKSTFYDAGGMMTRCIEAGEGEPVIMLHGMGGHAEAYIRNIMALSKHYHVYSIDMAGYGLSSPPQGGGGVPGLIDHLIKFIDAIGAEKVHLVGESLGGWVSAWTAIKYPHRIGKVVYVCGAGLLLDPEDHEAAANGLASLQSLTVNAFSDPTRESVRKRLEWLFLHPEASITDELLETRYQIYKHRFQMGYDQSKEIKEKIGRGPEWQINRERLAEIRSPFFFLWTDHNPTTPWQVAEKAHKSMKGSSFHVMNNCGHWPQYEDEATFNRLVIEFLSN